MGLRQTLGRIRWQFKHEVFDVFVRDVDDAALTFAAPAGYEFEFGDAALLAGCTPFHTELAEQDRAHGARRLAIGHRFVAATHAGEPVFTMWVNPRNLNVPFELKRALRPDQVFIYKAFTSPAHRGRKLYQAGMTFVLDDLARTGGKQLVGYAHRQKAASRAGLARLEFISVGSYRVLGYGTHRYVRLSAPLAAAFPTRVMRTGLGIN